jgi:SWI/SNF-related matrix-associated actin-dependent regulator 1 of chromatin subfamily A
VTPVASVDSDYQVDRSRATTPLFYRAPHPASRVPKEYQLAGVEYALERKHMLFGDAPGLGKTAEAIMLGNAIGAEHTLVICPASLRLNWEREIWAWSTQPNVKTYPILKSRDGVSPEAHYLITSYAMITNPSILNAIMDLRWDHLILDEAHALKDPRGNKRTQVICSPDLLPSVVGRITMVSGTILPNQPVECYNAFRLLNWGAIDNMSLEAFRNTYYEMGQGFVRGPVWDAAKQANAWKLHWSDQVRNVPTNLDDLQYRLRKHIMVRRLKEHVLHELPPKQWHPFPLEMTAGIRKALQHPGWKQATTLYEMNPYAFDSGVPIDGAISTARRMLGEAKAPSVAKYIKEMIDVEGKRKLVVSAWHRSVLAYLKQELAPYGLVYMDGSTSSKHKQAAVDQFQSMADVKIILGQMGPLGEGWTLSVAQDAVIAEPDWVPGKNDQLLDRIHRIGQEGGYIIGHMPVVPDTLDERILNTAIVKDQNIYKALDALSGEALDTTE